jgi:ArsR family transcriptional regulator
MGPEDEQQLATLCRALGHPARVTILRALLAQDVCVAGQLGELVPLAASTVSQHLKILKASGLIKGEIDGPRRCYCADRTLVARLQAMLCALSG